MSVSTPSHQGESLSDTETELAQIERQLAALHAAYIKQSSDMTRARRIAHNIRVDDLCVRKRDLKAAIKAEKQKVAA